MPIFDDVIDLTKHELQNAVIQNLAADPSSPTKGQVYFNTTTNKYRVFNGTTWDEMGTGAGAGDVSQASNSGGAGRMKVSAGANKVIADYSGGAGLVKSDAGGNVSPAVVGTDYVTGSSTNTFTNKTFDANGTGNSLSNVEVADFASGVINSSTTLAGATNSQIPTAAAVKAYADALIASADAMVIKGGLDCSTNPNYPAADAGWTYKVTVAGLLGGASGVTVQAGDIVMCFVDGSAAGNQATVGANWIITQANVDQATTAVLGLVQLATQSEAEAQSVSTKAVTPAALANYPIQQEFTIGDGTATSFTITHNRGNTAVIVQVRDASTNEIRYPKVVITNANQVTVSGYLSAPAANSLKVTIIG